ncbi:MAG: LysE family translocator [Verrucomicrobiales bacterium]
MTGTAFDLLAFAGVLAIGQFSPGPDMVLLTQTSLRHGRAAGWWTAAGITTGLTLHASVALFAWQAVSGVLPMARTALHWLAAAYLFWLAWQIWKERNAVALEGRSNAASGKWFRCGLLCNLLNPKVLVFFAALVVPFLGPQRPQWWPAALWGIIVFEGLFLWGLWVAVLQHGKIRAFHKRAAPIINGGFALALALLGVLLLFQRD